MDSRRASSKTIAWIAAGLLAVHAGLLAWGAWRQSPTIDEPGHLVAGLSHWAFGRFELYRVTPPLVRLVAALPVIWNGYEMNWRGYHVAPGSRAEMQLAWDFLRLNGSNSIWLMTIARWACIPFSLLGGFACYSWARDLHDGRAGLLALGLWCFSPNILAHAQLITTDVAGATFCVISAWLLRRWLMAPNWSRALWAGTAFGILQLTKATFLILYPVWLAIWILWQFAPRAPGPRPLWRTTAVQMGAIIVVSVYVVNLGYGFDGSFTRLGGFQFVSPSLAGPPDATGHASNRFRHTWLADIPVPFPEQYVLGIDVQREYFERKLPSYLRGEWREGGWWYYYLYALAIKSPIGTLLLMLLAGGWTASHWNSTVRWNEEILILAPLLAILTLCSSQTGFNKNLRYVLPVIPLAFVWISRIVHTSTLPGFRRMSVIAVATAWSIGSSLWYFPHSLSYFNEFVGGPKNGADHLLHSNIDWGQDLLELKRWLDAHPEAKPIHVAYFGMLDPEVVGIKYSLPPPSPRLHFQQTQNGASQQEHRLPVGWYAISVNLVKGHSWRVPDGTGSLKILPTSYCSYFDDLQPVDTAGYSILLYYIGTDEADRLHRKVDAQVLRDR